MCAKYQVCQTIKKGPDRRTNQNGTSVLTYLFKRVQNHLIESSTAVFGSGVWGRRAVLLALACSQYCTNYVSSTESYRYIRKANACLLIGSNRPWVCARLWACLKRASS